MIFGVTRIYGNKSMAPRVFGEKMCRLYGFHASRPATVCCELIHSQNALLAQSLTRPHDRGHSDGWGIAYYSTQRVQSIKESRAAHYNDSFKNSVARVCGRTVLAHIRSATIGAATLENTHPFIYDQWAFIHNGTLAPWNTIKPILQTEICKEYLNLIRGTTDSEQLFYFILSLYRHTKSKSMVSTINLAFSQLLSWGCTIENDADTGLNILLTDGQRIYGARYGRPLWILQRNRIHICDMCQSSHAITSSHDSYRAFLVASEPITREPWSEIEEGSIFTIDTASGFVVHHSIGKEGLRHI